jgi:CRISPR-associated endonuclease Cas1
LTDGGGASRRNPRRHHAIRQRNSAVLGHSGTITLDAFRWLDAVGVTFVHIDSDGASLIASSPAGLDDARLRRAQALAAGTDVGLGLTVDLLDAKLAGQANVARSHLRRDDVHSDMEDLRAKLRAVDDIGRAREIEATAAATYFGAWPGHVALTWARNDLPCIPEHWRRFAGRRSPLSTGSATRAADPVNALLNYMYALAEIECRRACLVLGLDPGLGFLHVDAKGRDSFALDLIETVRPAIDAFVLDLADGHVFRYADFIERDDGHCRILPPLTHRLAETLPRWETVVAPWAEHIAHRLADASGRAVRKRTPLTSALRRAAAIEGSDGRRKVKNRLAPQVSPVSAAVGPLGLACLLCGTYLRRRQRRYCPSWALLRCSIVWRGCGRSKQLR